MSWGTYKLRPLEPFISWGIYNPKSSGPSCSRAFVCVGSRGGGGGLVLQDDKKITDARGSLPPSTLALR
jgi:hypothetical protein